jgi:DNA-directed RNA polymerase beta subunit
MFEGAVVPKGVELRPFDDFDVVRESVLNKVYQGYSSKFPIENDRYRIELSNLKYPEKKFDVRDEKNALLKDQSLTMPLHGKLTLIDKTTKEPLDSVQGVIARVPYMTHRGTYINNGNEYSVVAGQQRLKPGVYARRKDNSELESHIATASGTGQGLRLFMEPETGVYRVMVGKSRMRLYPVLKGMGVEDQEMEKWWGKDMLELNRDDKDNGKTFEKFYSKFLGRKADAALDPKAKMIHLLEELQRGEIDEDVAERTLGMRQKYLSPQVLLRSSQKLLNIQKGLEEQDDRDSLENKRFMGQEDLFEERIKKDVGSLAKKLLSRSSYNKKFTGWVNGYFSPQLDGLVSGNSLANHIDGINPVQIMDFGMRVVQTGEGAIGDSDAIPLSARALHPSQMGALDFIRTPESGSVGIDQRFTIGALKGNDGNVYFPLRNRKTGKIEYMTPAQAAKKVVGFPKSKRLLPEAPQGAASMLKL